jgi:DhnA family fructose-bisphosphate aldolase class Ia
MLFLVFGVENSEAMIRNIKSITSFAEKCDKLGLPLCVEPTLWGKRISQEEKNKVEFVRDACRIAAELGADVIKAPYTGKPETFKEVVESCPVPVTILGGPKMETLRDLLETVRGAMDGGAIGVVFGRNIWQHPKPVSMIKAIKRIVHENANIDEALKELA